MHSILRHPFLFLFFSLCIPELHAAYTITGRLNMKGDWQHHIYLATINKLDDYYHANADHIIASAEVSRDGRFFLHGDNLPDHPQFYRLYLIKEQHSEFNACLFVGGDEHNFVHLLLHNGSQVEITADTSSFAPFGDYRVKGGEEAHLMKELSRLVYPGYIFYEIRFPSELQFSQDKLNRDLFNFADTCSVSLVSLAAMINTDFDSYFEQNEQRYRLFGEELIRGLPDHPYTLDYQRKLRYYADDFVEAKAGWWPLLSAVFASLSLLLLFRNRQLQRRLRQGRPEDAVPGGATAQFTPRELRILQLIVAGKTNKEIAQDLFIEVSTVKSHINKLYAKLQVGNRREAIARAREWKLISVGV